MGDGDEDETTCLVACPTCEGTGQQLPADGRPCVICDGSGLVTADVGQSIVESEEMEVDP